MNWKKWIGWSAAWAMATSLSAQGIDSLFAKVPPTVLPLLNTTSKLDLLDLYNSGLPAKAENLYGGQSELTKKTADFLTLATTEAGVWQMKVLPYESDSMIVCVYSHKAGGTSSVVKAYRRNWTPTKCVLPQPAFADFWAPVPGLSSVQSQLLQATLREAPVAASLCDSAAVLTYRISLGGLSRENKALATDCVHPVHYVWDAGRKVWVKQAVKPKTQGR